MEDKHIFKGEYVYSVRIDGNHTPPVEQMVLLKLKEFFTRACVARENKKDGTPHFQAVCWKQQKLTSTQNSTLRTYFKQQLKYTYNNAVSIVGARKVQSLAKYCNDKEHKGVISFGISDLSILGKWENKESEDIKRREELEKRLKLHINDEIVSISLLCRLACQAYVNVRPPPFKSLLQIGRSVGYLTEDIFIQEYYPSFEGHKNYERKQYTQSEEEMENNIQMYIIEKEQ
jgi:hypothetical protein